MIRYRIISTIICHLVFVSINHLYYRHCIGGFNWWSIITSFNAHANDLCSTTRQVADVFSIAVYSTIMSWILELPRLFVTFRRVRQTQ